MGGPRAAWSRMAPDGPGPCIGSVLISPVTLAAALGLRPLPGKQSGLTKQPVTFADQGGGLPGIQHPAVERRAEQQGAHPPSDCIALLA
jgi:hypothetical protein